MTASRMLLLIPKLLIIITVVSLNNEAVKNRLMASAQLLVKPMWDISSNVSNPCIVNDVSNDEMYFTGSPDHSCTLQVNESNGTNIHLQMHGLMNGSFSDAFIYIEHNEELDRCSFKYVVFNDLSHTCRSVVTTRNVKITLYGDVRMTITSTSAGSTTPPCPTDDQDVIDGTVNQSSSCPDVKVYSDKIKCTHEYEFMGIGYIVCVLSFKSECDVILGPREAIYECGNHNVSQTQGVFIPYEVLQNYSFVRFLRLSGNQITQLNPGWVLGLNKLLGLNLSNNMLRVLSEDLFQGLANLELLYLDSNHIITLNQGCFAGLGKLWRLFLRSNKLKVLTKGVFQDLANLVILLLDRNLITTLNPGCFTGLNKLQALFLDGNVLRVLTKGVFQDLANLEALLLNENHISTLNPGRFAGLNKLWILYLESNMLRVLTNDSFQDLAALKSLILDKNQIDYLPGNVFQELHDLQSLSLDANELKELHGNLFKNLIHFKLLNIEHNSLTMITHESFSYLPMNTTIQVSQHEICECFLPLHINCHASDSRSPYLTCDRLLSDKTLAIFMWLIGLSAFGGNLFVLIWRNKVTRKNKVNSLLLENLASSDFLMGIYMLMIGSADVYFGEDFAMQAETWRTGITCRIAGALSIISSEASMFFVMLISIDRFICICFPYTSRKFTRKSVAKLSMLIWILSLILGIVPSVLSGRYFEFYDNSHVCIGLPLALPTISNSTNQVGQLPNTEIYVYVKRTSLLHVIGHYYSTALFIGVNAVCYLVVLVCYIAIVRAVKSSAKRVGCSPDMAEQLKLTKKVTAIVATDFFCWAPIIILGILVQTRVIYLPPAVFAWCVTIVLPINSAINPFVYTIADVISEYRKERREKSQKS